MTSLGMHLGRKAEAVVEAGLHSLSCGVSPEWALPVTGASTQSGGVSLFAGHFLEALVPSVAHPELEWVPQG